MNFKFIFSTIVGGILEFYDFMLYGIFATVIAATFFPKENSQVALMSSLAVLAVGYFTRPLGGLLFGHFGDKYSRRRALTVSLILMGLITTCMGLLPGYQYWGITATILLIILRMLQGLTVGGEMPGAMIYLLEAAKPKHKAVTSIMSLAGAMLGVLLAVLVTNIITHIYTTAEIRHFAWRLPFLIGVLLAIVGCYLRLTLWQDQITERVTLPIASLFKDHWRAMISALLFLTMAAVYTGIVSIYFVPYVTDYFHYSLQTATQMELVLTVVTIIGLLIGAVIVDKLQQYRKFLLIGTAALVIISYPLFILIAYNPKHLLCGLVIFCFCACFVMGGEIVFLAGLFKKTVRYSGIGFTHGMAFSIFGGTAPLILNYAVLHLGKSAPGLLFAGTALLAFLSVLFSKQNHL